MDSRLCYIDAAHVRSPVGCLTNFEVRDADDHPLGRLEGFVLDAAERRFRYLVVLCGRWLQKHRYLLPFASAQLEPEQHAVRLDIEAHYIKSSGLFDPKAFPGFSDEDLLSALFGSTHAAA